MTPRDAKRWARGLFGRKRATLRIDNRTQYRTEHLRAFAVRARTQVFGDDTKHLEVSFIPSRSRCRGRASIRGSWSRIWLPANVDRHELAQILIHEFAHNAGAKGERWMRHGKTFGWAPGWRDNVQWAVDLPLELRQSEAAPDPADKLSAKLAAIEAREKAWKTKAKRAATALKKLKRQRGYYERRMAAGKLTQGDKSQ